jgi:catalase (peroxidase I)
MKLYSSSAAGLALLLFATPAFAQKTPKAYDDPAQKATADRPLKNKDWWPNQLNLQILHQNSARVDPMGETSTTPRSSRSSTWRR